MFGYLGLRLAKPLVMNLAGDQPGHSRSSGRRNGHSEFGGRRFALCTSGDGSVNVIVNAFSGQCLTLPQSRLTDWRSSQEERRPNGALESLWPWPKAIW